MPSFFKLVPFLVVLIIAFAIYQLVTAFIFASQRAWPFAALYAVMAFAGGALARALWINRRKVAKAPE
ncbi:MAG: hypothetical protein ABIS03_12325 [Gemmatimonadaceae bacterium]